MTDEEIKTLREIVLAGYLHDIGKFAQRAGIEKYRSSGMEEQFCPVHKGGWHSHQHVLYTEGVLQTFRDVLPSEVNCSNVINFAANHHCPSRFEEWCVAEGDRLSSGMDRRNELDCKRAEVGLENEHKKKFYEKPLISLLSTLQIDNRPLPKRAYHKLEGFEASSIFGIESDTISKDDYAKLWESFECDFKKLEGLGYVDFVKALDALLFHYTWCIPSSTINDEDISLYQHSKTTASFASVVYRYCVEKGAKEEGIVQDETESKFLFLSGDISGIQKYIFDLKSTDSSAKLLRAKSFELMALSDVLAENVIRAVDGSIADIITTSGGKFMLVLPNTESAKSVLQEKRSEFEEFFLQEFAGKLSIIISDGTEACGSDLCGKENVKNIIRRIEYDADCEKQKKMQNVLRKNGHLLEKLYENLQKFGECKCCETMPAMQDDGICKNCEKLIEIGGKLVRSDFIKYRSEKISHFGDMVSFSDEKRDASFASVNKFLVGKGQVYLPYIAPYKDGELRTFAEISDVPENGNNKLAMFKADIDNLGLVFSSSLGDRMSFSRYADMSRMFQLFFSAYYVDFVERKYKNKIYTVFSGGDDICVIGHWYDIMHFAADFHKELERFTNKNESITLSAGISLFSSNMPLKFAAADAEGQLERSKGSVGRNEKGKEEIRKNAITVFDTTVSWEEYDGCLADGEKFKAALKSKEEKNNLPTALVYKMLDFAGRVKKIKDGNLQDSMRNLMWKSNFKYMTARNLENKEEDLKAWFCGFGADDSKMEKSKIAVSYGLYTQRKNKADESPKE